MSWKVHDTDEVFAALRGLCANSYRMYDPCEHRYYYDHECDAYECAVDEAAEEYERLVEHCAHQREQLAKLNERWMNGERTEEGAAMSITDELRMYVQDWRDTPSLMDGLDGGDVDGILEDFIRIADRIDKEHAEAVADALQLRGEPDRWVKLPVDADGVPIRVGDELEIEHNGSIAVIGVGNVTEDDGTYGVFYQRGDGYYEWFNARFLRHVKPDSWERIIQDAIAEGFERTDVSAPCEVGNDELVERCRRLAGERG